MTLTGSCLAGCGRARKWHNAEPAFSGDTNVLIKTPGAGGVRIENQTGILTDWRGLCGDAVCHGLSSITVSRLIPIRWGNSIDVEKILAALCRRKARWFVPISLIARIGCAGAHYRYPGRKTGAVWITGTGKQTGITSMVGDDGQVYLSGAPLSGELLVQWGDGANSRCIAHYVLPKRSLASRHCYFGSLHTSAAHKGNYQ